MQLAFRRTAGYVRDVRAISTPLDRNARARLVWHAEQLERRTKLPGRRNGVLGYTSLAVLRALLFVFMNRQTGVTVPSYTALQCATGLCRQSIATALARLEAVGLVRVTRRLVRERRARVSPITGEPELVLETRQTSNAYAFVAVSSDPDAAASGPSQTESDRVGPGRTGSDSARQPVTSAESTGRTGNPPSLSLPRFEKAPSAQVPRPGRIPWWAMIRTA